MTTEGKTEAKARTIDTFNYGMVGLQADWVVIVNPIVHRMTKPQALQVAAWLVAIADDSEGQAEFQKLLDAVMAT
jgi:hypothetical protein